jgi:Uma2 family endonuclease
MAVVTVWNEELPLAPFGDWTVDDLARLPDDGRQYELFDGVLVVSPAPFPLHQRAVGALMHVLYQACPPDLEVFVAPLDFQPTKRRSLQPDLMVVRRRDVDDHGPLREPLVLAVEVLSKSTAAKDQIFKRALYADSRVEHFWVFDPREPSLTTYDLHDGQYVETHAAQGDETAEVGGPFPVSICPAKITRPGAGGS